jgi:hypothetical protein
LVLLIFALLLQPFDNVKTILGSQDMQKQAGFGLQATANEHTYS